MKTLQIREEVYKISVDPTKALSWLEKYKYDRQRPLTQTTVEQYKDAMTGGTFFHGSQIHIAYLPDGTAFLINGQHRLWALIESGKTMRFSLLESYCNSMDDINALYYKEDANKRRGPIDMVRATDMAHKYSLPATFLGKVTAAAKFIASGFKDVGGKSYDQDKLRDLVGTWAEAATIYFDILSNSPTSMRHRFYRVPVLSVGLVTLSEGGQKAKDFWMGIALDDGLRRGDPRKTFIDFFLTSERRNRSLLRNVYLARAASVAWNAFYSDSPLTVVVVPQESLAKPINILGTSFKRSRTHRQEAEAKKQIVKKQTVKKPGLKTEVRLVKTVKSA